MKILIPDDLGDRIKKHSKKHGETVDEFVKRAINETIIADDTIMNMRGRRYDPMSEPVRVNFILPKIERDMVKKHAADRGEDMSTFIRRAIQECIAHDNEEDE